MTIEIAKENKIKQNIHLELEKKSQAYKDFEKIIKTFIEKEGKQKIEGTIKSINIYLGSYDLDIKLETLIEDKLKLIEAKTDTDDNK